MGDFSGLFLLAFDKGRVLGAHFIGFRQWASPWGPFYWLPPMGESSGLTLMAFANGRVLGAHFNGFGQQASPWGSFQSQHRVRGVRAVSELYADLIFFLVGMCDLSLVVRTNPGQIPSTSRLCCVQIPDDQLINLLGERLIN